MHNVLKKLSLRSKILLGILVAFVAFLSRKNVQFEAGPGISFSGVALPPDNMDDQRNVQDVRNQLHSLATVSQGKENMRAARKYWDHPDLIWYLCNTTSSLLSDQGHKTTPDELLQGSLDVMEKLEIKPRGNRSFRDFCDKYSSLRKTLSSTQNGQTLTHDDVIQKMIEEKFYTNDQR